ncbi:MAG: hypothetical protein ABSE07_10685 [Methanoregula sp.]
MFESHRAHPQYSDSFFLGSACFFNFTFPFPATDAVPAISWFAAKGIGTYRDVFILFF